MNFWKDVERDRNAKEYEATLENLDMEFTIERTLEHNDYIREVGQRRRQVMTTSENCEGMNNLEQVKRTSKKKRANHTTAKSTKKIKVTNGPSASSSSAREYDTETVLEESELESIDAEEEIRKLTQDEMDIRNKLLKILVARQEKDTKSGKDFMTSIHLNGILDFSEDVMHEKIKKSLDIAQFTWLEEVLRRKTWNPIPEFSQYINQFTEDECTRAKIPTIVRKSCIIGRFDSSYYEGHDIAQQILTHFSVRLEAPIRVESKSLDLERTYAIDTTVYILNRLFRMHQDVLDVGWIELTTPDTKQHKIDGIFKVIKTTQKSQAIIIVEFSFARKAPETKEDGDQLKLCRNSMRILNKVLLQGVPKDKARVYLIQAVNGYIIIKYLVRPLPSIYILQQFIRIKIPVSFDDFEQFAKDMVDLMSWQADVLSTIKGINKSTTKDNHIHTTTVQDTPAKAKKAEEQKPSSPKSPCPGRSPSELPPLI